MMDNEKNYGKMQKLLDDPAISEIMINGTRKRSLWKRTGKRC